MIKLTQVQRGGGEVVLTFTYSTVSGSETVSFEQNELIDRAREFYRLMGRRPNLYEFREIVIELFNDIRSGEELFVEVVPWENWIGVDLE